MMVNTLNIEANFTAKLRTNGQKHEQQILKFHVESLLSKWERILEQLDQ